MAEDGLTFAGDEIEVEGVVNDERWEGNVVEAPTIHFLDGTYYLFYSANDYAGVPYAVGYATSTALTGPYEDAPENPILSTVQRAGPFGPGSPDASSRTRTATSGWSTTPGRRPSASARSVDRRARVRGRQAGRRTAPTSSPSRFRDILAGTPRLGARRAATSRRHVSPARQPHGVMPETRGRDLPRRGVALRRRPRAAPSTPDALPPGEPIRSRAAGRRRSRGRTGSSRPGTAAASRSRPTGSDEPALLRFGAVMYRCAVLAQRRARRRARGRLHALRGRGARDAVRRARRTSWSCRVEPAQRDRRVPGVLRRGACSSRRSSSPTCRCPRRRTASRPGTRAQSGIWQSVCARAVGRASPSRRLVVRPDVAGAGRRSCAGCWRARRRRTDAATRAAWSSDPDGSGGRARARHDRRDARRAESGVAIPDPRLWDIEPAEPLPAGGSAPGRRRRAVDADQRPASGCARSRRVTGACMLNGRPIYLLGVARPGPLPRHDLDAAVTRVPRRAGPAGPRDGHQPAALPHQGAGSGVPRGGRRGGHPRLVRAAELDALHADAGGARARDARADGRRRWATTRRSSSGRSSTRTGAPSSATRRATASGCASTYDWLKALDPTRLVVDNSACETTETPNFHVETRPGRLPRLLPGAGQRRALAQHDRGLRPAPALAVEPARRRRSERGDEPLDPQRVRRRGGCRGSTGSSSTHGREPWWFGTGQRLLPADRDPAPLHAPRARPDLADASTTSPRRPSGTSSRRSSTRSAELRRHDSIPGYVITELTDAYWEANGLLDPMRGRRSTTTASPEINAPDVVVIAPRAPRRLQPGARSGRRVRLVVRAAPGGRRPRRVGARHATAAARSGRMLAR